MSAERPAAGGPEPAPAERSLPPEPEAAGAPFRYGVSLYSFMGDWIMYKDIWTGRIPF